MLTRVTEMGIGRRWVLMARHMPISKDPMRMTEPMVPWVHERI